MPLVSSESYWKYDPSVPANAAFAGCFGFLTLIVIILTVRTRTSIFTAFVLGGLSKSAARCSGLGLTLWAAEAAGYAIRIGGHYLPATIPIIVFQAILILVAPSLLAATIYILMGRFILVLRIPDYSPIAPSHFAKLFVTADVVSFFIQIVGVGISITARDGKTCYPLF
ncbi:hypothetical protein BS50DRAFT_573484 [Corynespora cassiicola Philippines]|uniref:RTA1 like protein n=1 Tax=Corynespora cassiicola Philippines TaxID=1448308 RepID=A0A2T2NMQ1_CORCC|nr:hypothetical protein BS50DRAFT_573484 [Corynespora cassiicola Philippines]